MNKKTLLIPFLFLVFSSSVFAFQMQGQEAKSLYLNMKNFTEVSKPHYSLERTAKSISCSQYYLGLHYDYHQECSLIDQFNPSVTLTIEDIEFHNSTVPNKVNGAAALIVLLGQAQTHADHSNPPVHSLHVRGSCLLKSPFTSAEESDPSKFSCELKDVE